MSSYGQMLSDMQLLGMASLLQQDFGSVLNKCQREEVESYPWSFLYQNLVIYGSVPITGGSVTLTQNSTSVVGVGTSFPTVPPPLAVPQSFWLWVGPTLTTPVRVQAFNTPTSLTLTTPWLMNTIPGSSYVLQQQYFPVFPLATVERVRQIDDLIETSLSELNIIDPSRIATGGAPALRWATAPFATIAQPFNILNIVTTVVSGGYVANVQLSQLTNAISVNDAVTISGSSTGYNGTWTVTNVLSPTTFQFSIPSSQPNAFGGQVIDLSLQGGAYQIELWPRTSGALPYIVDGKLSPYTMVNPSDQPQIPSQVLEAKAMMYACRAVLAQTGNPKWQTLAEAYRTDYNLELEKAKQEDTKRVTPKGITKWGGRRLLDMSVDYNHDLSGPADYQTGGAI